MRVIILWHCCSRRPDLSTAHAHYWCSVLQWQYLPCMNIASFNLPCIWTFHSSNMLYYHSGGYGDVLYCSFGIHWWCLAPITLESVVLVSIDDVLLRLHLNIFFIFLSWLNTYDKSGFLLTSPLHAWAHCWNWHPRAKARCWSSKGERGGRREANSHSISEGAHEICGWVLAMSLIRGSHGSANEKKAHELHYVYFFTSTFSY